MKNSDKEKFKDILDWVARNFKKTLVSFEYRDTWDDLNDYPVERIEQAADYIRTNCKFYPTKADWMNAIHATHNPELFKALPEPELPETSDYKLWGELHAKVLLGDENMPDAYSDPIGFSNWMRNYLLDNGIEPKRVDCVYPKDAVPSWLRGGEC